MCSVINTNVYSYIEQLQANRLTNIDEKNNNTTCVDYFKFK